MSLLPDVTAVARLNVDERRHSNTSQRGSSRSSVNMNSITESGNFARQLSMTSISSLPRADTFSYADNKSPKNALHLSPRHQNEVSPIIRALAKAIYDDKHQPSLQKPNGDLDLVVVREFLVDMGYENFSDADMLHLQYAFRDYGQQLRGVDYENVKTTSVLSALKYTTAINTEATYGNVSVKQECHAVLLCHNLCAELAQREFHPKYAHFLAVILRQAEKSLAKILCAMKDLIDHSRNSSAVHQATLAMTKANSRLAHLVSMLDNLQEACAKGVRWFIGDLINDQLAVSAWEGAFGLHTPAVKRHDMKKMLHEAVGVPEELLPAMLYLLDPFDLHVVVAHQFVKVLNIWGSCSRAHRAIHRDVGLEAFSFTETEVEAGQRMLNRSAPPGAWCLTFCRDVRTPEIIIVCMDIDHLPKYITLHRRAGAWEIDQSVQLYETISAACRSCALLVHPCGIGSALFASLPKLEDKESGTACHVLHRACYDVNIRLVRRLFQQGNTIIVNCAMSDPAIVPPDIFWTPLMYAVNTERCDPEEVVELLINVGADINVRDQAGCTALYYSIVRGYHKTIELILKHNPNLDSSPRTDRLLLSMGATHYLPDEVDILGLEDMPIRPQVVEVLLKYVNSEEEVIQCLSIIAAKMRGVESRPDEAQQMRPYYARNRVMYTDTQQAAVDEAVHNHGILARNDPQTRQTQAVLRKHLFYLSCQIYKEKTADQIRSSINEPSRLMHTITMSSFISKTKNWMISPLARARRATQLEEKALIAARMQIEDDSEISYSMSESLGLQMDSGVLSPLDSSQAGPAEITVTASSAVFSTSAPALGRFPSAGTVASDSDIFEDGPPLALHPKKYTSHISDHDPVFLSNTASA